jgi:hypothetical protein
MTRFLADTSRCATRATVIRFSRQVPTCLVLKPGADWFRPAANQPGDSAEIGPRSRVCVLTSTQTGRFDSIRAPPRRCRPRKAEDSAKVLRDYGWTVPMWAANSLINRIVQADPAGIDQEFMRLYSWV